MFDHTSNHMVWPDDQWEKRPVHTRWRFPQLTFHFHRVGVAYTLVKQYTAQAVKLHLVLTCTLPISYGHHQRPSISTYIILLSECIYIDSCGKTETLSVVFIGNLVTRHFHLIGQDCITRLACVVFTFLLPPQSLLAQS